MAKYIELDVAKKAFQNMDAGRKHGSTLLTPEEFAEYLYAQGDCVRPVYLVGYGQ